MNTSNSPWLTPGAGLGDGRLVTTSKGGHTVATLEPENRRTILQGYRL